ncbi:hypothetical protein [Mesorhizobium sp. M0898]|uniref:hypothetical protein n=1 Tax=Mesorhizobium sp. M0898 TaxID=2957020 RepID=UPI00333D8A4F
MPEDGSVRDWLDHPDVQAVIPYFEEIVGESDRGATLITAEIINMALEKLIVSCLPPFLTSRKRRKDILDFSGPLGTFSARIKFAAIQGWISETAFNAVEALRELRNVAAHIDAAFSLGDAENKARLSRFLETGDGVAVQIHNINVGLLVTDYFEKLKSSGPAIRDEIGINPFETNQMIADELTKRPDWSKPLEERLPKLNMAVGAYLFVGLLTLGASKKGSQAI